MNGRWFYRLNHTVYHSVCVCVCVCVHYIATETDAWFRKIMAMRSVATCVNDYGALQAMVFSEHLTMKPSKCLLLLTT